MADAALQALGAVFITKPDFMLDEQPKAVVRAALQPAAPPLLKTRALLNLTELLKVQPSRLVRLRICMFMRPQHGMQLL